MLKLLLLLCFLLAGYAVWIVGFKVYKTQHYLKRKQKQLAKEQADALKTSSTTPEKNTTTNSVTATVDAYELQLFDDVAHIFMQSKSRYYDVSDAEWLQVESLHKMPMHTCSQIRKLDLGEWSIYWSFYEQSLEYYVGQYGIFFSHVDRFGKEHRFEIKRELDKTA